MNEAAKIVAEGIAQIRGFTAQDAATLVDRARRERRAEVKAAVLRSLGSGYTYPVEVLELIAIEGHHYGARPQPSHLDYRASMQYDLIHKPQDVRVLIGIDQTKARATEILRRLLAEFDAMTEEDWATCTANPPREPIVGESDDLVF